MLRKFELVFLVLVLRAASSVAEVALPDLVVSGFSWAENLVFDGFGSLFVAESVRGEIWKINLCNDGKEYCSTIQLTDGISSVGGMQIPPDGKTIYAGATLSDGTPVLISTPAHPMGASNFTVITKTVHQPNGVACDWSTNVLYYTFEGTTTGGGYLMGVDLETGVESTLYPGLDGADGAWFDASTNLLYVGLLTDKTIMLFNVSEPSTSPAFLVGKYPGLSVALDKTHMLDDITLYRTAQTVTNNFGSTVLLGADWLGSQLQQFNLDGTEVKSIPPPAGIDSFFQVTSVRWGKGPGFDPNSVYITEGGGLLAKQTDRRVIQIKMK